MRILLAAAMAAVAAHEGSAFMLSPSSSSFIKAQGSVSSFAGRFTGVTARKATLRNSHACSVKASLQGQDVMNRFDAIGNSAIQKLMDALPLRESNHVEGLGASSWMEGGFSGSVQGWTAEPKVGWISKSSMKSSDFSTGSSSLVVLMGPSYDTPHLWVDLTFTPQEILVNLDFPARVDLAANKDYIAEYYKSASGWYDSLMNDAATTALAGGKGLNERILASPMSLSLSMAKDQQSLDLIERAVDEQVSTWCSWIQGAREVNRMQFQKFQSVFPKDRAQQLAAAMVGPGDEQYVGSAGDNSE
ncbi:hypothetical protein GUITHDRAFT_161656, partial [Guillardia theta CCMP2712]